jgi:hypothetical protein
MVSKLYNYLNLLKQIVYIYIGPISKYWLFDFIFTLAEKIMFV